MIIKTKLSPIALLVAILLFVGIAGTLAVAPRSADKTEASAVCLQQTAKGASNCGVELTTYYCGVSNGNGGGPVVPTTINFGCRGTACDNGNATSNCPNIGPITDFLYAMIRFLSIGVGLVLVASMVYAGIQYISSRGEPQSTQHAIGRIRSNVIALILYIFTYAILSFVIPAGFFN